MKKKILLTSTSFQDTPGRHQSFLDEQGFELTTMRGPLKEEALLEIIGGFYGIICGDDDITRNVIKKGTEGKLRIISKYGIGLDKIDLAASKEFDIPVTNCPGVNQVSVAEHVFALLLSFVKNIIPENTFIQNQKWTRLIGNELYGKTIGIVGLGNVGKEVALRAIAFGLKVVAYDKFKDTAFLEKNNVTFLDDIEELFKQSEIISLNISLNEGSRNLIDDAQLQNLKPDVIIVNTARAGLLSEGTVIKGIESGIIKGYLTDVLDEEPMIANHPFLKYANIIITPHIGSRTYESVVRQGTMAVENLLKYINR